MKIFGGRRLKGLTVHSDETVVRPELIGNEGIRQPFDVQWGHVDDVPSEGRPLIYFPDGERRDVCEVFITPDSLQRFRSLLVLITHLGWQPIVRSMGGRSVLNTLIEAGAHGLDRVHQEAQRLLRTKMLRHSSQVDVAVCALFDFPPSRGSFMAHFPGVTS
jgi:hypothetical protein